MGVAPVPADPAAPAIHLLGVRHHGPGSARSVVAALDELRPSAVLVEAPAEATGAFQWIGADGLDPPVALLGHVVDEPQRAVFVPFASFSPEWQAVAWANRHSVRVDAIDLPLARSLAVDEPRQIGATEAPIDPIAALAAAGGEPDAERWWDDVIEHRGEGLPAFDAVAEAMAVVRDGTTPTRREVIREAHMRRAIRGAIKDGHRSIVVVCGAWHVPALDVASTTVAADAATLRGLPRVKVSVSWVPWTYERLAASSGYAAGVRSPAWYDRVFVSGGATTDAATTRFFVDAAQLLRSEGLPVSPDDLIAAARVAETLGSLRDRPGVGLDEILDAAEAVVGRVSLLRRALVVGESIGSVPDGAPQAPLARDVAARARSARLRPEPTERIVELDLRTPNGRRRSHLLHQLVAIGVPWGRIEQGRGSSGTFRETWRLVWQPEWSVVLVERSAYGTTLAEAATGRLIEQAARATGLVEIAAALDLALLASLPGAVEPIVVQLADRAATDPDIGQLMSAMVPLAATRRYGDVRSTDAASIERVFDGLAVRVLSGLERACTSLDDDAAAAMVERLSAVQHALALVDHPARRDAFPGVLERLAEHAGHGLVHGRATRLLHDGGSWDGDRVERRLSRALSAGTPPHVGAAFVEGFAAGSGTLFVHDASLLAVVDRWLSGLAPSVFEQTIALLRRTFGSFDPAERRQIGRLVSGDHIETPIAFGPGLDEGRALAAIGTARLLLGLPPLADPVPMAVRS